MSDDTSVPEGSRLIEVFFQEGQLGVTLRRRVEDGVVFVHELIPNTQGVLLDIELGDELWKVGDSLIGTTSLDKEAWQALVQYIKTCPRPLSVVWRRRLKDAYDDSPRIHERKNVLAQSPVSQSVSTPEVLSAKDKTTQLPQPIPETEGDNNQVNQEVFNISIQPIPVEEDVGNANDAIFAELSSKLYVKEKTSMVQTFRLPLSRSQSSKTINIDGKVVPVSPYTLPDNPIRRLIKFGEMTLTTSKSSSISISTPNKYFLLMSDILVVSVPYPNDVLLVEECINLQVCKVRTYLLPFSTPSISENELPAVFDLIWPNGSLQTGFMTDEGKDEWMQAIYRSICQSIGYGNDVIGWKHQHMLGTVHSAVVLRDAALLQSIVDACERQDLDFGLLEEKDDAGFTPLHYASIFRFTNMIKILHDASANAEIPDHNGLTCLHWSSMLLEDDALEMLTEHSIDIDVRDYDDRTSLFLLMVEGRDKTGRVNIAAMKDCGKRLLDLHAEPNVADHQGHTILHYLSASWMNELVDLVLSYNAEIMAASYDLGMTALHFACRGIPLRRKISEATILLSSTKISEERRAALEDTDLSNAIPTLKSLLRAGSRPNYKDSNGRTPLQHIAENWDTVWGDSLTYAVITLLTYGARMDESPQCQVLRSRLRSVEIDTILETRLNSPCVDADSLGITSYDTPKEAVMQQFTADGKDKIPPSCILCSVNFTMFRRQHHCRLCNALCCDDCSKRRAILQSKEVRACDSCYNRVSYAAELRQRARSASSGYSSGVPTMPVSPSSSLANQAKQDRLKLFGSSAASPVKEQTSAEARIASTSQTMSTMNEAHQRLVERGEKLSKLADKSSDLANHAGEFAKLAKQLRDQQKSGWF